MKNRGRQVEKERSARIKAGGDKRSPAVTQTKLAKLFFPSYCYTSYETKSLDVTDCLLNVRTHLFHQWLPTMLKLSLQDKLSKNMYL